MRQQFNEDRAEIEAHFYERVQAYVELGETPEQAKISAQEKFGETDAVIRGLLWQRFLHSPVLRGLICASGFMLLTAFLKMTFRNTAWVNSLFFYSYAIYYIFYAIYSIKTARIKKC